MGIDDAGHKFGAGSKEYSQAVIQNDKLLSTYIPMWLDQGYSVVVAADHGMSEQGYHGGNSSSQRNTALYILDSRVQPGLSKKQLTTLDMAPLLCFILGIDTSEKMKDLEVDLHDENKEEQ